MGWDYNLVIPLKTLDDRDLLSRAVAEAARGRSGVEGHLDWNTRFGPTVRFTVPRASLSREDLWELERNPESDDGEQFFVEFTFTDGIAWRREFGQWALHLSSNRSSNRVAWNTAAELMGLVADQLGGGVPDEIGPHDLTSRPLEDLQRSLKAFATPSKAWLEAHAPDGDVDAAARRLWNAATTEELLSHLEGFDPQTQLAAEVETVRLRFAKVARRLPALKEALRALEWHVEGKALPPALERCTGLLYFHHEREAEGWPAELRTAAEVVMSVVDFAVEGPSVGFRLSSPYVGVEPSLVEPVREVLRKWFPAPSPRLLPSPAVQPTHPT